MAHAMYFGSTKEDTYSHISTYTSGSFYDQMRRSVLECVELVLEKRIKEGSSVISIADYGTADGVNVFPLLKEIIDLIDLRTKGSMQVMIYLNDQPSNNFTLLHSNIDGASLTRRSNVFISVTGQSMYTQCLPTGSLDIAISSASVQWLSKIPCTIENGLCGIHGTDHEKKMLKEQAKIDWKNFLLSRSFELKSGGYIVTLVLIMETEKYGQTFFSCLSETWQRMYAEKKINYEEFLKAVHGEYCDKTDEDIRAAFDDPDIIDSGLQIVSITEQTNEMKPLIRIRTLHGTVAYANAIVKWSRPWLTNTLYNGLSEDRSSEEKDEIVEEYFHKLKTLAEEDKYKLDYVLFKEVVVAKL